MFPRSQELVSMSSLFLIATIFASPANAERVVVAEYEIQMQCLLLGGPGGPTIGSVPPCLLPTGIDSRFVSPNPSGEMELTIYDDDTASIEIELEGLE